MSEDILVEPTVEPVVQEAVVAEPVVEEVVEKVVESEDDPIPKGVQKRINRAVREKYEAQAEAKVLADRLQRLEESTKITPQVKAEPRVEDYTTYEDYLNAKAEAIAERKVTETLATHDQNAAMERAQAAQRQTVETWTKKVSQVTAELPDFADVVGSSTIPMPDHIKAVIMQSEIGPRLAYYLAEHPDEAESIVNQHPIGAIRALMRIEDKINALKTAKKATDAPPPIKPSGSTARSEKDPSAMTPGEFANWRRTYISQRR